MVILKSTTRNSKATHEAIFDIEPQRVQIMPYCFSFVTVSFTPQIMNTYNTIFEAALENTSNTAKLKTITFEIIGEGNLPRFTVVKPTLRNKKGQFLVLFKRTVINHVDHRDLSLSNEGTLPTKVFFSNYHIFLF